MFNLSFDDRLLGWTLGLGDLQAPEEFCHGFENVCLCPDCRKRDRLLADTGSSVARAEPVPQPWEVRAA